MSTRQEYVDKVKAKLDEWSAEIDVLEDKARQAQAQAKETYNDQVRALQLRREEASQHLQKVQNSSEDAWLTLKDGADRIWKNMSSTLQETKKAFFDGLK